VQSDAQVKWKDGEVTRYGKRVAINRGAHVIRVHGHGPKVEYVRLRRRDFTILEPVSERVKRA
jgi:hypothetical protein